MSKEKNCDCSNGKVFLGYENGEEIWGDCEKCVVNGEYKPKNKELLK